MSMTEDKAHSTYESRDSIELSEAQRGKGVQVAQTVQLPEGYVPPSGALFSQPAPTASAAPADGAAGAGHDGGS
jgi:hypothetical protein